MTTKTKRSILTATVVLAVMLAALPAGLFAQEKKAAGQAAALYNEIAGNYEFQFQGQVMVINFYVQEGKLFGSPTGQTPEELVPVKDKELQFEVSTTSGESFQILFKRNENKKIDKCTVTNQGQEIEGIKK